MRSAASRRSSMLHKLHRPIAGAAVVLGVLSLIPRIERAGGQPGGMSRPGGFNARPAIGPLRPGFQPPNAILGLQGNQGQNGQGGGQGGFGGGGQGGFGGGGQGGFGGGG